MAAGALPHSFRLAADDLKRIIDKTRFAISTEETRYYLNGIYVHAAKDAKPRGDARRGHRRPPPGPLMSWNCPMAPREMPGVIIPAQDGGRTAQAAGRCRRRHRDFAVRHQDPVRLQWRGADLQADRRQFPAL